MNSPFSVVQTICLLCRRQGCLRYGFLAVAAYGAIDGGVGQCHADNTHVGLIQRLFGAFCLIAARLAA